MPNTNIRPFSEYETQSAHFVRQWWPSLPVLENMKRSSCAILLLSFVVPGEHELDEHMQLQNAPGFEHPPGTHLCTIAQHYFSIPAEQDQLRWWYVRESFEIRNAPVEVGELAEQALPGAAVGGQNDGFVIVVANAQAQANNNNNEGGGGGAAQDGVGAVLDQGIWQQEEELDHHHSPLIAVDFGCATWIEYVNSKTDELRLRFVMFPGVEVDRNSPSFDPFVSEVRTLDVPEELDLRLACHIGLDQSQGTIILGLTDGSVFVLHYL